MSTFITGQDVFRSDGCNVLSAPGTTFAFRPHAQFAGMRFIPQFAYAVLQAMSGGALTVSPGLRIGTNGTHDDVCPIFIPPTNIAVGRIGEMPRTVPLVAPPIALADLLVELTQSGVGPASMIVDVMVSGILFS